MERYYSYLQRKELSKLHTSPLFKGWWTPAAC